MTTAIKFLIPIATITLMSSFAYKSTHKFIGTFGVSAYDPAQIKLTIHSDHTFCYQDFSNPDKKINVTGNWTLQGKKVVLRGSNFEKKFHNVWTFDENGQVAKSRKRVTFYRLTKIDG